MEKEIMDIEELNLVTSVVDNKVEIWMEHEDGTCVPITDYEFDLENGRILLKG